MKGQTDLLQLIVNVNRGEWSQLARGTHALMESRGPSRYKDHFDLPLLESQLGFIVGPSLLR